ncbi:unnamed protein product [Brassicogethes aeneus]|uniref:Endonuclease/exonuclease/phosphatase domain-containing protein n=1 Tax=Brassicogethes aeneus TaxID=1431903 RepID=A0A9P0BGP2_BRAAE|nr:unnamed protein product [Brassicogethes aeneus]
MSNIIKEIGLPVVIGMDSNAKNPIWQSSTLDHRGELLESFAFENDLFILNTPQPFTTFSSPLGESNVDLTLCSSELINKLSEWTVSPDICPSDHRMISYKLALLSPKNHVAITWARQLRQIDTDRALDDAIIGMRAVDGLLWSPTVESIDRRATELTALLASIGESCLKRRKRFLGRPLWWNDGLDRLRLRVNLQRKAYQRANPPLRYALRTIYLSTADKFRKLIERTRSRSWGQFVGEQLNSDPWSLPYRLSRAGGLVEPPLTSIQPYCTFSASANKYIIPSIGHFRTVAASGRAFRSCIVVLNPLLHVLPVQCLNSDLFASIIIECGNLSFALVSAYCPPRDELCEVLEKVSSDLNSIDLPVIIGMDSNAKSPVWFSDQLDHRGDIAENFVLENN